MPSLFQRRLILFFGLLFFIYTDSYAQLTTVGKEFYLGFMENNRVVGNTPEQSAPDFGIVIITAAEQSTGTIEYGGRTVNFNLNQGQEFVHVLNDVDMLHRNTGIIENKSVYIQSSGNVSVYAFNERIRSADGTVILPITTLGKDYYVVSHYEFSTTGVTYNPNINDESTFLIVAVEDQTKVEITPSVQTLSGQDAAIPYTIELNSGQTYQIKAMGDLTGTRIRVIGDNPEDCKNLAAFGGNKWTSVGNCGAANDHLYQQLYPINTWGTEHIHIPLRGRTSGDLVKILASENGTTVNVNGNAVGDLDAGNFITLDFGSTESASIVTSKPSSVTVFSKSQECNEPAQPNYDDGDPFMMTYSPNNQLLKEVTFHAIQLPSITSHFVNVIVETGSVNQTRLDNNLVGNEFQPVPENPTYSYARIQINQGIHRLQNPEGFIAYVYGFGFIESYGYAVGASLDNLNFEIETAYEFDVNGENVACLDQQGTWEVIPDNDVFTYFLWNFGDGSELKEGQTVAHTFTEPGEYEVLVICSISPTSCDEQQEVVFTVNVVETNGEIKGLTSVCPEVEEIEYNFGSENNYDLIEWKAEGGEVIESTGTRAVIRWGEANPDAKVIAIPYTEEGCPGMGVELLVNINRQIISELFEGETAVCFDETTTHLYEVPNPVSNRSYEWHVTGGEIVAGNGSPVVEINWTVEHSIGELYFVEQSLDDALCEGTSPVLEVTIHPGVRMDVPQTLDVLCHGDATGSIELNLSTVANKLTYEWSHDVNLNGPVANNLEAGLYSVRIVNEFGCELISEAIEISQPQLLEVTSSEVNPTSCFGREDGLGRFIITGGTAPYTTLYEGAVISGNEILVNNLSAGEDEILVTDAQGCNLVVPFIVESPNPKILEVRVEKQSCPGETNGQLLALPDGAFGPYSFEWEWDGSTGQSLEAIGRGIYQVSAMDNRGCISEGIGEMLDSKPQIRMPTGFKSDDGLYEAVSDCGFEFKLSIFNRWGQLIYSGDTGWDGQFNGVPAPMGSYSYHLHYEYNLNGDLASGEKRGVFTLIR